MEVKNTKKRNVVLAAVLLGVAATVGTVGVTTFAKYKSQLEGVSSNVTVAKWAFDDDNSSVSYTVDLTGTYIANTLVSNRIAPGTQGKMDFALSNEHTETATDYSIALTNTGAPTNIKFYSDSDCTTELTNATLTGTLNPGATATTVTIYWKWAYETGSTTAEKDSNDIIDTSNGKDATADGMTVTATITGTQKKPTA